jgi:electron transport complex protein RnfG
MTAGTPGNTSRIFKSAGLLGLVAVLGTSLLAGVNELTRERIAEQERRLVLRQLNQVLPAGAYDNSLQDDFVLIDDRGYFGHADPVRVYRARLQDRPVAVIMNMVAADGYNGDIRLLAGIYRDGTVSGVRVIAHRETPGLGDPIEHERSDWILGFTGRSLDDPSPAGWAVRRDGGEFDQFTGATITPRAIVEAVQRALEYHATYAERLYQPVTNAHDAAEAAKGDGA